jgi:hypothetical protein
MKGTHSERDKEVRDEFSSEVRAFIEDLTHRTRAELPAALPAPPEPRDSDGDVLGEPLTMREVGALIGCSAWTVRQKYVPAGLPHLRSGPNGKLIFYRTQVISWLLERQRKGGIRT